MDDMRSLEKQGILDPNFVDKMQEVIDSAKGQESKAVRARIDDLQKVRSEEDVFRTGKSPPHTRKNAPTRKGIKKAPKGREIGSPGTKKLIVESEYRAGCFNPCCIC